MTATQYKHTQTTDGLSVCSVSRTGSPQQVYRKQPGTQDCGCDIMSVCVRGYSTR